MSVKKLIYRIPVIFAVILCISSCATVKDIAGLNKVYVTNTKQINVLPPSSCSQEYDGMVLLTVNADNQEFSFIAYLQCDMDEIYISLMNDFGVEMGSLYYDGKTVDMDCPVFPSSLKGEYLVNDIQNIFYDENSVKENLNASKLDFVTEDKDGVTVKKVLDGSRIIEEITIDGKSMKVHNFLRKYEYSLEAAG